MFVTPISGDRKLPTCATRDIAAVAARLLLDHSWSGHGHVAVLGPEDLSFNDMAQIMSEVLGKPVRFQQIPGEAFKARLTGSGMSDAMAQGMVDMMMAKNQGLDNLRRPRTYSGRESGPGSGVSSRSLARICPQCASVRGVPAHVRCWLAPAATHADPGRGRELPEVLRSQCRSSAWLTGRAADR